MRRARGSACRSKESACRSGGSARRRARAVGGACCAACLRRCRLVRASAAHVRGYGGTLDRIWRLGCCAGKSPIQGDRVRSRVPVACAVRPRRRRGAHGQHADRLHGKPVLGRGLGRSPEVRCRLARRSRPGARRHGAPSVRGGAERVGGAHGGGGARRRCGARAPSARASRLGARGLVGRLPCRTTAGHCRALRDGRRGAALRRAVLPDARLAGNTPCLGGRVHGRLARRLDLRRAACGAACARFGVRARLRRHDSGG